jgi:hypothetical protein
VFGLIVWPGSVADSWLSSLPCLLCLLCLQFRGDIDDRMLPEAVAPLLESLHLAGGDVATPLGRRFNMTRWFNAQGLSPPLPSVISAALQRQGSLPPLKLPAVQAAPAPAGASLAPRQLAAPAHDASAAEVLRQSASAGTLLVCDFDRTLVDWDAGELSGCRAVPAMPAPLPACWLALVLRRPCLLAAVLPLPPSCPALWIEPPIFLPDVSPCCRRASVR